MDILGISCFYHDSAAVLVRDGKIIAAAQEERFTRKKHDFNFPKNAIAYVLREGKIDIKQVDLVAFYDKPMLKFERMIETYLAYAPKGLKSFIKSIPLWLKQKIWMSEVIRDELGYDGKVIFPEHHLSHAASAFYPSPYDKAAILTIDGVGEWTTTSFGVGRGNKIELTHEMRFPHSLGLLYSALTYYTGFKVNSGEYKVMGLAPYGEPKYVDKIINELIDLKEDGSFRMRMEYFDFATGLKMTSAKFDELFGGPARKPESELTQREMDIARSLQDATEEIMLRMARHIQKETGMENLCLAGGVALNCVGNGKILRSGIFKNIWIQPAAGDAGGALGAALAAWHDYSGGGRESDGIHDKMGGAYLGPAFSDEEIEEFLSAGNIPHKTLSYEEMPKIIAGLVASENVIGWHQGRMEFGPRALGARSIIGDARSPKMQATMNLKIKFRESFRPFAPSVLVEKVSDWFELDRESPYMLLVANVRPEHRREMTEDEKKLWGINKLNVIRSTIPAITHIDYSARVQTVHAETNPLYHKMISEFFAITGCPVIINTSFNVRGEPIVCTPKDSYLCFMRTEMDYLILGKYLIDKREQPKLSDSEDWRKKYELD